MEFRGSGIGRIRVDVRPPRNRCAVSVGETESGKTAIGLMAIDGVHMTDHNTL